MRTKNTDSLFCLFYEHCNRKLLLFPFFQLSCIFLLSLMNSAPALMCWTSRRNLCIAVFPFLENCQNRLFVVRFNYSAEKLTELWTLIWRLNFFKRMRSDCWTNKIERSFNLFILLFHIISIVIRSDLYSLLHLQRQPNSLYSNIIALIRYIPAKRATDFWHGISIGHRFTECRFPAPDHNHGHGYYRISQKTTRKFTIGIQHRH